MKFPKIVIVMEGGVIQNILTDNPFVGDIYIIDRDDLKERVDFSNLDELIAMDYNMEVDEKEVNILVNMTHREWLEEDDPELLEDLEKEEFEFEKG